MLTAGPRERKRRRTGRIDIVLQLAEGYSIQDFCRRWHISLSP